MTVCNVTGNGPRRRWLALLARAGRAHLEAEAARLGVAAGEAVRPAEIGMVMLRGRVGGTGDPFHLGEATVTRCAVRVGAALGVGYVLGRDRRKAELVAAFDAALQDPQRQPGLLRELIEPLEQARAARDAAESRLHASSKVAFFTLVRGDA